MADLAPVFQRYPPDCQPSHMEPLGSAGGMSGAQFWRITAPRPVVRGSPDPAHVRTLALRRWPAEHPTPDHLHFIHAVLRHAADRGITVLPLPIVARDGSSFVAHAGYLWELTPWLPGAADYDRAPSDDKLRAAMTALAQFHVATADFKLATTDTAPAITRRLARLHQLTHGGIQDLSRAITSAPSPELGALAQEFIAILPRAVPHAVAQLEPLTGVPLRLQPCIRDIWHDHVLFTGNEVTGLVDFGALDIDTPATDIARLLGSLVGDDVTGWQTGLAAYSAIRPLSQQETLAVFALDASGIILAGCNWIGWIYVEGRRFENRAQVVERFRRICARMAKAFEPRSGDIA
jgi:homoserine kinase type II